MGKKKILFTKMMLNIPHDHNLMQQYSDNKILVKVEDN